MNGFQRPTETKLTMRAELEGAIRNTERGTEEIIGAASKILQLIAQNREQGGTLVIQPQIMFLTGAVLRMMKDVGVVEHLQRHGTAVRGKSKMQKDLGPRATG